jgi:uncharacterized protein YkwD
MDARRVSVVCLLLLSGCATQVALQAPPQPPADPTTLMPALESRIYELVEAERHKLVPSAKPLALDSELVGVAREKSADMAARNYFAHAAPDGETSAGIIMDKDASFQGLLGENIAAQPFFPKYGVDVEVFAHRLVDIWLASPKHRDNLADPAYDRTGVGAAASGDTVYVTELFARELGAPVSPPRGTPPAAAP